MAGRQAVWRRLAHRARMTARIRAGRSSGLMPCQAARPPLAAIAVVGASGSRPRTRSPPPDPED